MKSKQGVGKRTQVCLYRELLYIFVMVTIVVIRLRARGEKKQILPSKRPQP
jgi:hypothetical protein